MNLRGLVAFHSIDGVGWHTINRLLKMDFTFEKSLSSGMYEALRLSKISVRTLQQIKKIWQPEYINLLNTSLKSAGIDTITFYDKKYPKMLREIAQPPWVLYLKGNPELLHTPCLAIVGTRKPTPYGLKITHEFARDLSNSGWTIVSGLALGIDGQAHRSVMSTSKRTIAVLGTGIDIIYPRFHRALYKQIINDGGLIIAESNPGTEAKPGVFPKRNRIISGLSYGTLVVEAAERSGSLITADHSLEQGREVYIVPGPIYSDQSRGTNNLIKQGAKCVTMPTNITEDYPYLSLDTDVISEPQLELTAQEQILFDEIQHDPVTMNYILFKFKKMSICELQQILLSLEIKQKIVKLPGAQLMRK